MVLLKTINLMEKEKSYSTTEIVMKGSLAKASIQGMDYSYTVMVVFIKDHLKRENMMEKDNILGPMATHIQVRMSKEWGWIKVY